MQKPSAEKSGAARTATAVRNLQKKTLYRNNRRRLKSLPDEILSALPDTIWQGFFDKIPDPIYLPLLLSTVTATPLPAAPPIPSAPPFSGV